MLRYLGSVQFSSVQSLSRVRLFATLWIAARQASLSITISQSSLRLTSIESVMPSRHLILGHPLLLLPPIPPSIRVFSNGSTLLMRWPKYWSFSFSIIPSKEIPELTSFRMDWLYINNLYMHGVYAGSLPSQPSGKPICITHLFMSYCFWYITLKGWFTNVGLSWFFTYTHLLQSRSDFLGRWCRCPGLSFLVLQLWISPYQVNKCYEVRWEVNDSALF